MTNRFKKFAICLLMMPVLILLSLLVSLAGVVVVAILPLVALFKPEWVTINNDIDD